MTKSRIVSALLASALCLSVFSGCGNGGPAASANAAPSGTASQKTAEKVTLTWAIWDKDKVEYYQQLADAYNKEHSNVEISFKDLGSSDYQTALGTQLAGGDSGIDIVSVKDIPGYASMTKAGELLDLTQYISDSKIDTSKYGNVVDQIKVDGKVYELPYRNDIWVVYYNKDLFDKAKVAYPTNDMTFDQYDALARKLAGGSGNDKVYGNYYHKWRSTVQLFGILDGKHTVLDGDYSFLKPYYNTVLKEQQDGICMDYATLKTSNTTYQGVFENNQAAMLNMGGWFLSTIMQDIKAGKSKCTKFGMVKYPHPAGVEAGTTLGTITGLAVTATTKHKDEACDFLKFVTGEEGQKIIAKTASFPAIQDSATLGEITALDGFPTDQNSKDALKTVKTYLEMALNSQSAAIDKALNDAHDAIMSKSVSVDDGISQMNTNVKPLLGK